MKKLESVKHMFLTIDSSLPIRGGILTEARKMNSTYKLAYLVIRTPVTRQILHNTFNSLHSIIHEKA